MIVNILPSALGDVRQTRSTEGQAAVTRTPRSSVAVDRNASVEDVRLHLGRVLGTLDELCQVLPGVGLATPERVERGGRS